jgi:hypothetical protein
MVRTRSACASVGLLCLLLLPSAGATSNTWTDPAGDQGILVGNSYDILSATVASDGTHIRVTVHLASLRPTQHAVLYTANLYDATDHGISISCTVGWAVNPLVSSGCTVGHETEVVEGVALATAVPFTSSVDATAHDLTVTIAYADVGAASGDSLEVVSFSSQVPPGVFLPSVLGLPAIAGDQLDVESAVTLA